ncbi:MAG: hypothetical protein ACTSRZ_21295, partial [Promethearchaeota archaeon]
MKNIGFKVIIGLFFGVIIGLLIFGTINLEKKESKETLSLDNNQLEAMGYPGPSIQTPQYTPSPAYDKDTLSISSVISDWDGVRWADLYYKPPGQSYFSYKSMSKDWFGNTWSCSIGPFIKCEGYLYLWIQAADYLGYTTESEIYQIYINLWDKDAPFIEEPLYYNPDPATDKDQISIWSNNIFDDKS